MFKEKEDLGNNLLTKILDWLILIDMNIVELLNQLNFTTLFLIFIVSKLLIETYLKTRNIKSINENKEKIPERFTDVVTDEEYKKSINYNIDTYKKKIYVYGIAETTEEREEVISEAKQILDVEDVIASILLVDDLRVQKN